MHQNTTKYTIEDLKKYRNAILLRMKLEGLEYQKNLISVAFLESIIKCPEYPIYFLYPDEIKILYKYYKSYLPGLNKKELLSLLGHSTKLPLNKSINKKVYFEK